MHLYVYLAIAYRNAEQYVVVCLYVFYFFFIFFFFFCVIYKMTCKKCQAVLWVTFAVNMDHYQEQPHLLDPHLGKLKS